MAKRVDRAAPKPVRRPPPAPVSARLVAQVRAQPGFSKLSKPARAQLLAVAERLGGDPATRANVLAFARNPQVGEQPVPEQIKAVQALAKAAGREGVGVDVARLSADDSFDQLDDRSQDKLLGALVSSDEAGRRALLKLARSAHFQRIEKGLRQKLLTQISGRSGRVGASAADAIRALMANTNFRALPKATREALLDKVSPRQIASKEGRLQLLELGRATGFRRLSPEVQQRMLRSFRDGPPATHALTLNESLVALATGPGFRLVSPPTQLRVLDVIRPGRLTDDAHLIADLASRPSFAQLRPEEQHRLLDYVGGTHAFFERTRMALSELLFDRKSLPKNVSADQLRAFLRDQPGLHGLIAELDLNDPVRQPYVLHGPQRIDSHPFASGSGPADRYEVEVAGRRIPVFYPVHIDPTQGHLHTPQQVALTLAGLPPAELALVREVAINPGRSPSDAHFARVYGNPDFRAYATAGAEGVISIFPTQHPQSQQALDRLMVHELGHVLSIGQWGDEETDPRWDAWKRAAASDGLSASTYAKEDPDEDFAESLAIYQAVRGTPHEAELRALFPARFALLDQLLGGYL